MSIRIASLALVVVFVAGCQQPQARQTHESPRMSASGQSDGADQRSTAGDRDRPEGASGRNAGAGQPANPQPTVGATRQGTQAERDQHGDAREMNERQRQEALRACTRLDGNDRRQCERDVEQRASQGSTGRDD